MSKIDLLKKIGFSDEYLNHLEAYELDNFTSDFSSATDETKKIVSEDSSSLEFNDIVLQFDNDYSINTKKHHSK